MRAFVRVDKLMGALVNYRFPSTIMPGIAAAVMAKIVAPLEKSTSPPCAAKD